MTYFPKPRNGYLACFEGREYRSTQILPDGTVRLFHDGPEAPADDRFVKHADAGAWELRVPALQCDRVVQVNTLARYKGYDCEVEAISADGTARLYVCCGTPPEGFEQIGWGEFRGTVPCRELEGYKEVHSDLLFLYWRAQAGAGLEEHSQ